MEILSDSEIDELLRRSKYFAGSFEWPPRWRRKTHTGHREAQWDLTDTAQEAYRLVVRINERDPADFSVVLVYLPRDKPTLRLMRCNGPSHEHRNVLENERFGPAPHIHIATERYQAAPAWEEDGYAQETDEFHDVWSAMQVLWQRANITPPSSYQLPLLDGEDLR